MQIKILAGALGLVTILASQASTQERKLKHSQLPAAVQRTADEQGKGATVRGYTTERDGGQTVYEVEMTVHGRSRDVTVDSTGTVLEVEEQVVLDSLPEAVRTGLRLAAGSGQITKVESLTKLGRLVAYEAQVRHGAKRSEVQVGPDGKPLAHPQ
ncbi:MAG TPA: PepSY domain-containing protein [Gemmatimonadales bacterium]|nr:PepSY domain-containing protein [Gemmatimonadales bacterium]